MPKTTMRRFPEDTTALWPEGDKHWRVTITWAIIDSRAQPVGLTVLPADPRPTRALTSRELRTLRLNEIAETSRRERLNELEERVERLAEAQADDPDNQTLLDDHRRALAARTSGLRGRPGRGGAPVFRTDKHYAEIAQLYRDYLRTPGARSPRKFIAEHYNVSPSLASKWLARARRDGLLEPPHKGGDDQ